MSVPKSLESQRGRSPARLESDADGNVSDSSSGLSAKCDHDWQPYRDLPGGEVPGRHHQCGRCQTVGHTKQSLMRGTRGRKPKVFPYGCVKSGCRKVAVDRVPGRGTRGALLWVCRLHRVVKS